MRGTARVCLEEAGTHFAVQKRPCFCHIATVPGDDLQIIEFKAVSRFCGDRFGAAFRSIRVLPTTCQRITTPVLPKRQRIVVRRRIGAAVGLVLAGGLLSGCTSAAFSDLPAPIGLPKDAPARAAIQPEYPAVHDLPPPRPNTVMTEKERKDLEKELAAERDRLSRANRSKSGKKTAKRRRKTRAEPAGSSRDP